MTEDTERCGVGGDNAGSLAMVCYDRPLFTAVTPQAQRAQRGQRD